MLKNTTCYQYNSLKLLPSQPPVPHGSILDAHSLSNVRGGPRFRSIALSLALAASASAFVAPRAAKTAVVLNSVFDDYGDLSGLMMYDENHRPCMM